MFSWKALALSILGLSLSSQHSALAFSLSAPLAAKSSASQLLSRAAPQPLSSSAHALRTVRHTDSGLRGLRASASQPLSSSAPQAPSPSASNILILDHLNINHLEGRHDILKAFYYQILGCAPDPRKEKNLAEEKGTLWANIGINQFHLPEASAPQILDGRVVIRYDDLGAVESRLSAAPSVLSGTKFAWKKMGPDVIEVACPWGNKLELRGNANYKKDPRGQQPGEESEPLSIPEVLINVPWGSNMAGIARFYEQLVGAKTKSDGRRVTVECGNGQELIFQEQQEGVKVYHDGYHISMYVSDFQAMFSRMEDRGLIFVNPRFKRKAETLEEAIDQCMFRVLKIVDPEGGSEAILELEHEIRSTRKADGSKYKSCPFYEV